MTRGRLTKILDLLEEVGTRREVEQFLRDRNLPHSAANWEQLKERRLRKAVDDGDLSVVDLEALLAEAEEHGRQHVFLLSTSRSRAKKLVSERIVRKAARRLGIESLLSHPDILVRPEHPRIVQIRWDGADLVVKTVETREHRELVDRRVGTDRIFLEYKVEHQRAVNVVRLTPNGRCDVRIERHKNRSDYEEAFDKLAALIRDLVPVGDFAPTDLNGAIEHIGAPDSGLDGKVRVTRGKFTNSLRNSIIATAGNPAANLHDDAVTSASIIGFREDGSGKCEELSFEFLQGSDGKPPSRNLRVIMVGSPNEFMLSTRCSPADYEYALDRILVHNE